MADRLRIPGPREVRASLDSPAEPTDAVVVACPPHPRMGGDRRDARLRAVSDALREQGIACLRIDYGPWDEGAGEQTDARRGLAWAGEGFARVGLFGYSFGAGVALLAAADAVGTPDAPERVATLAPPATVVAEGDVTAAVDAVDCPLAAIAGERDESVDWQPVVERARERGHSVEVLPADHFFAGQRDRVADRVASFFRPLAGD
jgi:hypothetical protein